jgi:hypothetical protein
MDASKYVPTVPAQNSAINVVRPPWEACQNFQKTAQCLLLEIYSKITVVRTVWTVRNPYNMDCTFCLSFRALFLVVRNSKIRTVRPFLLDCTFPLFMCLLFLLYDLLNPYSTACLRCCPCCLDFCASLQPWNACPSSAKMASSPNSKMLSLLLSQQ